MKEKSNKQVLINFIKRYGYIVLLSVIMLVISIIVAVSATKPEETDKTVQVGNDAVTFYNPLLSCTVAKEYNDKNLVYNTTLKQWEAHKGVCLTAAENSEVFAVLDGTVEDVYSNYLNGTVVVINHGGNLKTSYASLKENVAVKVGDVVSKGDVIGRVGVTENGELNLGNHLHFEVIENSVKVDPMAYLNFENK